MTLFRELVRSEQDRGARSAIMESLAEIRGGQGVPLLVELARNHPNADIRSAALHELSEIGDPKVREMVAQLLRKP